MKLSGREPSSFEVVTTQCVNYTVTMCYSPRAFGFKKYSSSIVNFPDSLIVLVGSLLKHAVSLTRVPYLIYVYP